MSKGNVIDLNPKLSEAKAKRETCLRKMDARKEAYVLLIPVVEKMRKMGLSGAEIGRLFKFLGDEFCKVAGDERPKPRR